MSGAFDLDQAPPWGRNRAEYLAFFDLLDRVPETRILDCGAVPRAVRSGVPMGQGERSRVALMTGQRGGGLHQARPIGRSPDAAVPWAGISTPAGTWGA